MLVQQEVITTITATSSTTAMTTTTTTTTDSSYVIECIDVGYENSCRVFRCTRNCQEERFREENAFLQIPAHFHTFRYIQRTCPRYLFTVYSKVSMHSKPTPMTRDATAVTR
ncbi:hypothetical protein ALC53_11728 [Atta colombica]|uniref:Uncharacterized protein n=1 Tax=Atta colombica TaxID=520822 RepID=A0A195AZQ5_9HYME|nr:hypothetical protein ALC53_11728 [Atta colombica]